MYLGIIKQWTNAKITNFRILKISEQFAYVMMMNLGLFIPWRLKVLIQDKNLLSLPDSKLMSPFKTVELHLGLNNHAQCVWGERYLPASEEAKPSIKQIFQT